MTIGTIIQKRDPSKNTESTSSQILTIPQFDSRMYQAFGDTRLSTKIIRELRRDPTIQLARMAVVAPIIHTPWIYAATVKAPGDGLDFIKGCLEPCRNWFLQTAVYGSLDFGWQPFELVFSPESGSIRLGRIKPLLQEYTTILAYIDTGEFAGFVNEPAKTGVYTEDVIISERYACNINLVVEGTNWYGESVFEHLYNTITNYNEVEKVANRYDRKVAGATWVVYYPVGISPYKGEDRQNDYIANEILLALEASGGVAVPDEIQDWMQDSVNKDLKGKWRIELITDKGSTQASFIDRQKYLDTLKMRAFGLPERSILEGTHGTKAEAGEHTNVALATVGVKHHLLCTQINQQIIDSLLILNYGKKAKGTITISPAPLVSAQFQAVKEFYRQILQTPETLIREYGQIDTDIIRTQLGVPSLEESEREEFTLETEKKEPTE